MGRIAWIAVAVVALLLLLACGVACVGAAAVLTYGPAAVSDRDEAGEGWVIVVRERVVSAVPVVSPATLEVRNRSGNVTISTDGAAETIQVEATKEARSVFGAQGERLLRGVVVLVGGDGSRASVQVMEPEGVRLGEVSVDLRIIVPTQADIVLLNGAGNILVEGTGGSIRPVPMR